MATLGLKKPFSNPAPGREGRILGRAGATAMMDDSDGIALSLYDLLGVNDCGFSLDTAKLPQPAGIPADPGPGTGSLWWWGLSS